MTETEKRTPGPWFVVDNPRTGIEHHRYEIHSRDDGAVCFLAYSFSDGKIEEANARFIVQACNSHDDLVAALEHAVSAIEMVIRNRPQTEQAPTNIALDVIEEQARAALAKAKL